MGKIKNLMIGILGIAAGILEINDPTIGENGTWGAVSSLIKETFGIYSEAILFIFIGISFVVYYFYDRYKNKKDKKL
jgi:hypothetical protein